MEKLSTEHDIIWLVLDALRYDVAQQLFEENKLPNLQSLLPKTGWQQCHSPASFTYPAHHAFFTGFLPTPVFDSKTPRLFAADFIGSETTTNETYVFSDANIIEALKNNGYLTICIGGVGFFNKQTALSRVLPQMFEHSYWQPGFGVTEKNSTFYQFKFSNKLLENIAFNQRFFLFINISAIHQPNNFYLSGQKEDNLASHAAALIYVDQQLPALLKSLKGRKVFGIICSDHGTAYGEDGIWGHRNAHQSVMEVPYAHFTHEF